MEEDAATSDAEVKARAKATTASAAAGSSGFVAYVPSFVSHKGLLHNPASSTSNANKGGNNQASGLELSDELGPPVPISNIEAQLDEAEPGGKAFAKPSGKLEQIKDDEGPHHASTMLAASLEATNKSPARRHVEIINDNAAPFNPFDSTAGEFAKPSGKLEQIIDDEGPHHTSTILAASLESTDKGADKRHVETMNAQPQPNRLQSPRPFNLADYDEGEDAKLKNEAKQVGASKSKDSIIVPTEEDIADGAALDPANGRRRQIRGAEGEAVDLELGGKVEPSQLEDKESEESLAPFNSELPVLEAYAVEEESEQEVVIATQLEPTLPWWKMAWKQRRTKLLLGTVLVVVTTLAIALGVSMSSSSSGGEPTVVIVEKTSAPSTSIPSVSLRPSNHPSLPPTTTPSQSPTFTRLESKLVAEDGAAYDRFGDSVAVFGDTLVVGAPDSSPDYDSRTVYIYHQDSETKELIFQQKLVPDDGAVDDWFGGSVAIYGNTIVVGAEGDDDKGDYSGSAYIYHQDFETKEWIFQQKLVSDDEVANDCFGWSVAIYENTVVVGAYHDDDKGTNSGSVYIYHQDLQTKEWIFQQKLVPDAGAAWADWDEFGWEVAIYDSTIVVGAYGDDDKGEDSGSAYIYHQDLQTKEWIFQQKLVPDDGAAGHSFGGSAAIFGDTIVVGAYGDDDKGEDSGSAYIYHQDFETKEWIFQQKLVADDGAVDDWFGSSVAIYGNTIVVGAEGDDDKGDYSGSAYIYHQDPETKEWILQQKLVADDGAAGDEFGWEVAIYDSTIVVGAYGDDDKGENSGSVFVYSSSYTRAPSPVPSSSLAPSTTSMPSISSSPSAMPTQLPSTIPSTSSSPTETCYWITIAVVYDGYPEELSWKIASIGPNGTEAVVKSYDEDHEPFTSHAEDVCLPEGKYDFIILDYAGDGLCCNDGEGNYIVTTRDGEMIAKGGAFVDDERTRFVIPFTPVQPTPT